MDEPFEIIDPENARNFLSGFMQRERKKGQSLADRGSVVALTPEKPGTLYFAMVRDGAKTFRVSLLYSDESGGWEGFCECEAVVDCIHAYAAMQALLMEHSAAMVRNLSANKVARETRPVTGRPPAQPEPGIAGRLKQTLDRALNQQEARYARIVSACFERTRQRGYLTVWDFSELGFNFGDYSWNSLKLWPTLPKDEYEFWLYVAWTARQKRFRIPPFMEEITDFSMVEERIKKWERQKRLDEWSRALENFQPAPIEAASELDTGETELRLLFLADSAQLQWRRPQQAEFGPVKDSHIARINDEEHSGWLRFNPASALLWSLLMPRMAYARTANFSYHDQAAMDVLGRILRTPLLEKMVLSADGTILDRREDTLQWALGPAESEAADYSFRLALSDGSPAPPILLVSPGRPWLYVTARGIFPGPPSTELLDPKAETLVPAPAIESATGVNFLNSLGVPLPERIAAKVQNVPLKIQIECNLQPAYIGAKSEVCAFRVRAVAEDGHEEAWNGSDWQAITAKPRKKRRANSSIVVYDRRLTSMVPALMSPLGLKRDTWQNSLTVRVTRNFPELFSSWMKALPSGVQVEMAGELASLAAAEVSGTVKLDVTEAEIDWFDLKVVLDVTDTTLTKEEIALLLKARGGFVRLTGKGWRRLRFDLSEEEDERL
ncbi:MAG TPA: hypothetical protein VHH88_11730, partial [Verrucomicrobiae bacterium]|nr:hypothetical protein [Verrucomicrobiae bacterium]